MNAKLETYIVKKGSSLGIFVDFPISVQELRKKFEQNGIDKDNWKIAAVKTGDDDFGKAVIGCRDLDELNFLGYWISQLNSDEYSLFFEYASAGCADGTTICEYINLAANFKSCYRVDGIQNALELGQWRVSQYEKEIGHPIPMLWESEKEDFENLGYAFAANFHGRFFNGNYYARFSTWSDIYSGDPETIPLDYCLTDSLRIISESHG
ncbi:MAG: hypothetical protein IJB19_02290 [Clostridia bacterium]|nr:hypothetical protein [Clostridia bacterium]